MKALRLALFPISVLYGILMFIRNIFFDLKLFPSKSFQTPIINVGNLAVGGTGKTPHIEYILQLLNECNSAVLSRGYGRITSGFIEAKNNFTAAIIGDESTQIKKNFPKVIVAVDEKRVRGVKKLLNNHESLECILLDDAYQHRSIEAGLNILLTTHQKLYTDDFLMPTGNLREWSSSSKRADIIIVSKSPQNLSPFDRRKIQDRLNPKPYQKVFFSYIKYGNIQRFNSNENIESDIHEILLITGIANPELLKSYLEDKFQTVKHIKFPDHHKFSQSDLQKIQRIFNSIANPKKAIITTEKDAVRLSIKTLEEIVINLPFYTQKMKVCIGEKDKAEFDDEILNYVKRNKRIS